MRSVWVVVLLAIISGVLAPGLGRPATADAGAGLERLGRFLPPDGLSYFRTVGIDPLRRRLYLADSYNSNFWLMEYDLTKEVPTFRRKAPLIIEGGVISPNTFAIDAAHGRAFVLGQGLSTCPRCSVIHTLDLETLTLKPQTWNVTLMVPNFYAAGIAYSAEDSRIYAVGTVLGAALDEADRIVGFPATPVTVLALDAESGAMGWVRTLPECQHAAIAANNGGAIFRSKRLQALYIPCIRPDPVVFNLAAYPGQTAIMRLWIDPDAGSVEASDFRSEIFAISGRYTSGRGVDAMAVMDETADRLYLSNTSNLTSGAWVFDGLLSAWVGFVPAVDNTNLEIGVDQSSGHIYMRSGNDNNIIVSDGRATPVPQGEFFSVPTLGATTWYLNDPITHRVFVRSADPKPGPPFHQMLVLRDRTSSAEPPELVDYDGLTTDVAEGPGTLATFAGSANGFGARVTIVGGYGGVISPLRETLGQGDVTRDLELGVSPGPRGLALGRLASIDLRNVGASVSAQALAPDTVTLDEYESRRNDIGASGGQAGKTVAETLAWPWPAAVCLDADEHKTSEARQQTVGRTSVTCDLKTARASGMTAAEGVSTEGLSVAGASFSSTLTRATDEGTVTESKAVARGIDITLPGFARLSIGLVAATVRTAAHGRPGTAVVRWTREIEGVLLTDASGKVLFRCPEACSPDAVADSVNERIGQRIRISVPEAERAATPRGAYAGIKKTRQNYLDGLVVHDDDSEAVPALELLVVNDTAEKSRVLLQLAAIQASSIYGISLLPSGGGLDGLPAPQLPGLPTAPDLGLPGGPSIVAPSSSGSNGPTLATTSSSLFAVRSPADAFFISLICVLILATAVAAFRRHRFASLLNGGTHR